MKIIWVPSAIARLEEIHDFIAQNNPENATRFVRKLFERIKKLQKFPNSGRVVPEKNSSEYRELIESNYRIVYRLKQNVVEIVTIFEGHKLLSEKDLEEK